MQTRHTIILSLSIILVITVGGSSFVLWYLNNQASESASRQPQPPSVIYDTPFDQPVDRTAADLAAELSEIQSAEYTVMRSYAGQSYMDSVTSGRISLPLDFSYEARLSNPDELVAAIQNGGEDETSARRALQFLNMDVVGTGGSVYQKVNYDPQIEAGIIDAETLADENFHAVNNVWQDVTYGELLMYPRELYYAWYLGELAAGLTQTYPGVFEGAVDTDALESAEKAYRRQWFNTRRVITPAAADVSGAEAADTDTSYRITVLLAEDLSIDSVEMVRRDTQNDITETTTFYGFNAPVVIPQPAVLPAGMPSDSMLNRFRYEVAETLVWTLQKAYEGETLPISEETVTVSSDAAGTGGEIYNALIQYSLDVLPESSPEEEERFWGPLLEDPGSDDYYFGYSTVDGTAFDITYVQELTDPESALGCEPDPDFCIASIGGSTQTE